MTSLQQVMEANPVLTIIVAFLVGMVAFLIVRFVFKSLGCIIHIVITVAIMVGIYLLLRGIIK